MRCRPTWAHATAQSPLAATSLTRILPTAQVFRDFSYTPPDGAFRKCFNVNLNNLVNSLAVFASSDGYADLCLRWPDRDGRLLLQLNALRDADGAGTVDSCTYAEVSCEECTFAEDLEGEMLQPRSQFTLQARATVWQAGSRVTA